MKRSREDDACDAARSYESPVRPVWTRTSHVVHAADITPTKRQRDRSVPLDAMSRLMTAATSAARMKKRAQMTLTSLFGGSSKPTLAIAMGCCAVCAATTATPQPKALVPMQQLQRCAHCERAMGACCSRECDNCTSVFCSQCSTINCDEQYDRVFCLSCNYDLSR